MFELIFNATAGTQKRDEDLKAITDAFSKYNLSLDKINVVEKGADLLALTKNAVKGPSENIVVAGGDGTISAVASEVCRSDKTLGVLPRGTFNFFAKNLNIPIDLDVAIENLRSGRVRRHSIGRVNDFIFLNNASIGIYPRLLKAREEDYKKFGRSQLIAYYSLLATLLKPQPSVEMKILVGEKEAIRYSPFIFVASNAFQLDFFNIPGSQCIQHDSLAVYISRQYRAWPMIKHAIKVAIRRFTKDAQFEQFCTSAVRIDTPHTQIKVALDGEIHTLETPLRFRMEKSHLKVWTPHGT